MKFALFLLGSWTEPDASEQSRIFGEMMEQIEYAEELGFDSVWIAEHHSSRYGICPSSRRKYGFARWRPASVFLDTLEDCNFMLNLGARWAKCAKIGRLDRI